MPQKNLIIFIILSSVILIGWIPLQQWLWPPPPPKLRLPNPRLWTTLPPILQQAPGFPGIGNACRLVTQAGVADFLATGSPKAVAEQPKAEPKSEPKPEPRQIVQAPRVPVPQAKHRELTLGNDDSFLKVIVTSEGAGVRNLILNKFQKSDPMGRPVWTDKTKKKYVPFDLIPERLDEPPSNVLFHYAQPVEGHPDHPLDTLGKREWAVKEIKRGAKGEIEEVSFTTRIPEQAVAITKTYTLAPRDYHLGLTIQMERDAAQTEPSKFRYQLTGAHGLPVEGEWYTSTYRNALVARRDSGGSVWRDLQEARVIGHQAGGDDIAKDDMSILYTGITTQYFASVVAVDNQQAEGVPPDFVAWVRPTLEGESNPKKSYLDNITVRLVSESIELKPGKPVTHKYLLYNGPVKVRLLGQLTGDKAVAPELVNRYENVLHLNTLTDYHSQLGAGFMKWISRGVSSIGWTSLLITCTNFMHGILEVLHSVIPNYGVCIILLTLLVRGIMFPLSRKQAIASAKMQAKMAELAPDLKRIEEKYKYDPMLLQQKKSEFMMKSGVNPAAMMGTCWILFLQMPIFLGLYYALQESIHFRLAPFLWISNLAAPDMLIEWGESIPFISRPADQGFIFYLGPFFNLLPVIAVALMMVQQKLLTPPPTDEQQVMQQKVFKWMTVVMGFVFYKVAAGLCIYFIVSSLWGITERKLLPKAKPGVPGGKPSNGAAPMPQARSKARSTAADRANGRESFQKVRDWWDKVLKEAKKK